MYGPDVGIRKPRPSFDPEVDVYAVCPACAVRRGALIDALCPVCEGQGVIVLGLAGLAYDDPVTVSTAVTLTLRKAAEAALQHTERARVAPRAVPEAVARLVRLGLLRRP